MSVKHGEGFGWVLIFTRKDNEMGLISIFFMAHLFALEHIEIKSIEYI